MRHIIPISGKDSLATALFQTAHEPDLPYEYMFNPTGSELPESEEWLKKIELYMNKPIVRIGAKLEWIIEGYNFFLPSPSARYCTRESKLEPMLEWIGKEPATIYYGIRADEKRSGFSNATSPNIIPKMPLQEHGIGLQMVYLIINKANLKPPTFFWESVYREVCDKVGEATIKFHLTEWQIDMLFAGRTRNNCFHCFNQRLYEWVWLLETHPELFEKAEWYEHQGTSDKIYHWNSSKSLSQIKIESQSIKEKHIQKIVKFILSLTQMQINFGDEILLERGELDILAVKSCGLLCGK